MDRNDRWKIFARAIAVSVALLASASARAGSMEAARDAAPLDFAQSTQAAAVQDALRAKDESRAPATGAVEPADPRRATPRATVLAFLQAARRHQWDDAARYLDLSALPDVDAPELARQFKTVLDRRLWVDLDSISDDPAGRTDDGLDPRRDLVGTLEHANGDVSVWVERVDSGNGRPQWKFAGATLRYVPDLYAELGVAPLTEHLPQFLQDVRFLEVALWQWIALVLVVFLAWAASYLASLVVIGVLRAFAKRSRTDLDDRLIAALAAPARLLFTLGAFNAGLLLLRLSARADEFLRDTSRALVMLSIAWTVFRIIDLFAAVTRERLAARGHGGAIHLIPLGKRAVKIAIGVLTFLAALDTFGFDVTAIIAGLGLGGLAIALAAQKTIENVFGGVTVLVDQPVRPGDLCRFGDKTGTVEDVGLRSTRVRTAERTVISVPNAEFANLHIENLAGRDRILLSSTLKLRVETTPEQLREVIERSREVLQKHRKIEPETSRVRFVGFGDQSLDVEVFAYVITSDTPEFLAVREELLLEIIEIVAESGTGLRGTTLPPSATLEPRAVSSPLRPARNARPDAERAKESRASGSPRSTRGT